MSATEVAELTYVGGSRYDAQFASDLSTIYQGRLFGFANYNYPAAGSNVFPGNIPSFMKPTQG
jgi:hypothetical protein